MLTLLVMISASCDTDAVYEQHIPMEGKAWNKDSVMSFEVTIEDTTEAYELMLYLRNNNQYPYSNIYFFRSVVSERGTEFADTVEYRMADPYGKWLGKGVGSIRSHEWPYHNSRIHFNHSGTYTFKIQHAMRTDHLEGLESVGIGVFKSDDTEKG